jgi:hypothetical protein
LEQRHRPAPVGVAELPGWDGEESLEELLLLLVQQPMAALAPLIFERCRIAILSVGLDPVVDALPGYAEHPGDVGGGATMVELQDSESPPIQAGIARLLELTPEAPPLPGS